MSCPALSNTLSAVRHPVSCADPRASTNPELCADFTPEGGAALARTVCHNVTETRLGLGRTQCVEDLALEPHAVDYTRAGFLCPASLVGTGQA